MEWMSSMDEARTGGDGLSPLSRLSVEVLRAANLPLAFTGPLPSGSILLEEEEEPLNLVRG